MEVWDLYDDHKNKTGKHCTRGEEIPEDLFHLVVHIWIVNDKGEYLISQRSEKKSLFPLMWECAGGAVLKDETSLQAALRETKEEVGIDLDPSRGKLLCTKVRRKKDGMKDNNILDVWLFEYNGKADLKNATTDEVKAMKWMTKDEMRELLEKKELVPTMQYFFDEMEN